MLLLRTRLRRHSKAIASRPGRTSPQTLELDAGPMEGPPRGTRGSMPRDRSEPLAVRQSTPDWSSAQSARKAPPATYFDALPPSAVPPREKYRSASFVLYRHAPARARTERRNRLVRWTEIYPAAYHPTYPYGRASPTRLPATTRRVRCTNSGRSLDFISP